MRCSFVRTCYLTMEKSKMENMRCSFVRTCWLDKSGKYKMSIC